MSGIAISAIENGIWPDMVDLFINQNLSPLNQIVLKMLPMLLDLM